MSYLELKSQEIRDDVSLTDVERQKKIVELQQHSALEDILDDFAIALANIPTRMCIDKFGEYVAAREKAINEIESAKAMCEKCKERIND